MPRRDLMRDTVTLVKKDGTVVREGIQTQVSSKQIITFDSDLPLEPGDHFLRTLPSGLVENYEVDDPNFVTGHNAIPSSFQAKVHRTREAVTAPQQVIQRITAHFHGSNARFTVGTDNSINLVGEIQPISVANLLEQVKSCLANFPEPQRTQMAAPIQALENEMKSGEPHQSKLRAALQSAKTIAEGAAGNLFASGTVALINRILGG